MKHFILIAALVLAIAIIYSNMVETSPIGIDQAIMNHMNPMHLIHSILKDPEFLSLAPSDQLNVLIAIYNIVLGQNKPITD
jgi:sugar phosphate isomerase/epimerase